MAPFNTFFGILILAIPLVVAIPRYAEIISFQVTSLEASSNDAPHVLPQAKFEEPVTNVVKAVNPSGHISSVSHSCSGQEISLDASSDNDAHCGITDWPQSCWKYCGDTGELCWTQPSVRCEKDSDCDAMADCYGRCTRVNNLKSPEFEVGNHRISVKVFAA